jgi:hypothetical protein
LLFKLLDQVCGDQDSHSEGHDLELMGMY